MKVLFRDCCEEQGKYLVVDAGHDTEMKVLFRDCCEGSLIAWSLTCDVTAAREWSVTPAISRHLFFGGVRCLTPLIRHFALASGDGVSRCVRTARGGRSFLRKSPAQVGWEVLCRSGAQPHGTSSAAEPAGRVWTVILGG